MTTPNQKCIERQTDRGLLTICSFCTPEQIEAMSFRDSVQSFSRYNPIISKKESLIEASKEPDANVTIAFTKDQKIVGFSILQYAQPDERWARVGDQIMMEVAVVEVSSQWRSMGISKQLVNSAVDHPLKEDRIFYMVGYSWTWDLDGFGGDVMAYRDMMVHLFAQAGFKIYQTNESNILLRPENLFMARIGADIAPEIQKKFKLVLFNMDLY